jgi:CHAT domain-containing protein/tetratricopeptide (TPR) repeat protein
VVVGADVRNTERELVNEVITAVLGASSPTAWREVVHRYGPLQLQQPGLGAAVLAGADDLDRLGHAEDAQTVRRWQQEVSKPISEQEVMIALLAAPDDAAAFAVLDQHPGLASAGTVEGALSEVHELLAERGPYPPDIARQAARPTLVAASRIARYLQDDVLRHRCLFEQAMLEMLTEDYDAAGRDFGTIADFWESRGDLFEAGRNASMAGDALRDSGRTDEALTWYQHAVAVLQRHEDGGRLLGPTYEDIAQLLIESQDDVGALENLELALKHRTAADQAAETVPIRLLIIALRIRRREAMLALAPLEQLVRLLVDQPSIDRPADLPADLCAMILDCAVAAVLDTQGEAEFLGALRGTGAELSAVRPTYRTYVGADQLGVARRWADLMEQALGLAPDEHRQAMFRYLDAVLLVAEGNPGRAVDQARGALDYFTAHDAATEVDSALALLMQAETARGQPAAALGWADQALDRSRDASWRATVLIARADCLSTLGRTADALADLHEAVDLSHGVDGDLARVDEGAALSALGDAYDAVGDLPAAIGAHRDALRIARWVGHTRGEASELASLGIIVGKLATAPPGRTPLSPADRATLLEAILQADPSFARDPQPVSLDRAATALLEEAGRLSREIGDKAGLSGTMTNLANLMPEDENPRKIEILTEVIALKRAIGDRFGEAVALANLAAALRAVGEPGAAATAWEQSLAISRDGGFFDSASQSLVGLARLRRVQGDPAGAERDLAESIAMTEAARLQVPLMDRYRVGFIRGRGAAYGELVDLLTERGAYDEAFDVVQQAKSRALLEIAAMTDIQPTHKPQGRFAELLDQEAAGLASLRSAAAAGGTGGTGGQSPADLGALSRIYEEMSSYDPDYVSMRRGSPATLAKVRAWLAAQGRPVLLVEYFLSGQHLTVFLLRGDWTSVVGYRRPVTTADVQGWYADFRRQVVRYRNAASNSWTAAADVLTRPLADYLRAGDLVYLVPHRLLHGLPMHALPAAADPLIADHPVTYSPASGLLPLSQNAAKGSGRLDTCAAFGFVFEEEARQVAALFGAQPVERPGLTGDDVERLCQDRDICHFSCHGHFDELYPLSSGLVLRPGTAAGVQLTGADAVLSARQIMRMRLRGELICLSACETAMSEVGEGDELLGLIRAFLYAGAPSVVASLWKVDAESARDLMVTFYRHLRESYLDSGSIDKSEALRQAQLRVMEREGVRSSFHWAPFILVGDWR